MSHSSRSFHTFRSGCSSLEMRFPMSSVVFFFYFQFLRFLLSHSPLAEASCSLCCLFSGFSGLFLFSFSLWGQPLQGLPSVSLCSTRGLKLGLFVLTVAPGGTFVFVCQRLKTVRPLVLHQPNSLVCCFPPSFIGNLKTPSATQLLVSMPPRLPTSQCMHFRMVVIG